MFDSQFREWLEENNESYVQEVDSIKLAHELGLLTIAFVFDQTQTKQMLAASADIICVHLGLTGGGTIGAKKILSLEAGISIVNDLFKICEKVNPNVIRMAYGDPIDSPLDADFLFKQTSAQGYIGGFSFERTPVESNIGKVTNEFKTTGIIEFNKQLYQ
jgi:predicted TIM-barrel enzyme